MLSVTWLSQGWWHREGWLSQHLLQEHPPPVHLWPTMAVPDKAYQRSPADVLLSLFSISFNICFNFKRFFSNK